MQTSAGLRTSVLLNSTTTRDIPYACRGEEMTFICLVVNGISLQWVCEPDIPCNRPLGYTTGDDEGETRTRGYYHSRLVSVARSFPDTYLSSVLTFTPPGSMDSVTVVCGDQLSLCPSTEDEYTVNITGKCNVVCNFAFSFKVMVGRGREIIIENHNWTSMSESSTSELNRNLSVIHHSVCFDTVI